MMAPRQPPALNADRLVPGSPATGDHVGGAAVGGGIGLIGDRVDASAADGQREYPGPPAR